MCGFHSGMQDDWKSWLHVSIDHDARLQVSLHVLPFLPVKHLVLVTPRVMIMD